MEYEMAEWWILLTGKDKCRKVEGEYWGDSCRQFCNLYYEILYHNTNIY